MPGTSCPMPGGLSFYEVTDIIQGLARRGKVVGMDVAEYFPALDIQRVTALVIMRLMVILMGTIVRTRGLA
jgi:agmatinase